MKRHRKVIWRRYTLAAMICLLLCGCLQTPATGPQDAPVLSSDEEGLQFQSADRPPSPRTLYATAEILAAQGKDSECESVLRRCVGQYPSFIPSYNRLAELLMRQGRMYQAKDILAMALTISPEDPVLLNNLGMCHLMQKQYRKALDCFTEAGRVPESEKYRANMATALGLLGRNEEALALLRQVLPEEQANHNAEVLRRAFQTQGTPERTSG